MDWPTFWAMYKAAWPERRMEMDAAIAPGLDAWAAGLPARALVEFMTGASLPYVLRFIHLLPPVPEAKAIIEAFPYSLRDRLVEAYTNPTTDLRGHYDE